MKGSGRQGGAAGSVEAEQDGEPKAMPSMAANIARCQRTECRLACADWELSGAGIVLTVCTNLG
jgi:hypothetical protein